MSVLAQCTPLLCKDLQVRFESITIGNDIKSGICKIYVRMCEHLNVRTFAHTNKRISP